MVRGAAALLWICSLCIIDSFNEKAEVIRSHSANHHPGTSYRTVREKGETKEPCTHLRFNTSGSVRLATQFTLGISEFRDLKSCRSPAGSNVPFFFMGHYNDDCKFKENLLANNYNAYESAAHPGMYIGLSKTGKTKRGNRVTPTMTMTHFLPRI
eukprot:superscaffoldBa00001422_g10464